MYSENLNLPMNINHIHDLTLKDLIFCPSSMEKEQKEKLGRLVHNMGGYFQNGLLSSTNYVLSEDIFSKKSLFAYEHRLKVIRPSAIENLWEINNTTDDPLSARIYFEKYELPIFNNLKISSTGLSLNEKREIAKLLKDNGGEYCATFSTKIVKVLLMRHKDLGTEKHKAALQHKILCVSPDWIIDSVKAGHPLDIINDRKYLVEGRLKASTPERDNTQTDGFDNTMLSVICDTTTKNVSIDETQKSLMQASISKFGNKKEMTFKKPVAPQRKTVSTIRDISKNNKNDDDDENCIKRGVTRKTSIMDAPPQCTDSDDSDCSYIQLLMNKTVCIYGYENLGDSATIIKECSKLGAILVDTTFNKNIDYVITAPGMLKVDPPKLKYTFIVSDLWLDESSRCGILIEPKFQHYPLFRATDEHRVIVNELFVSTNYSEKERTYVREMVEILGGIYKETLVRHENPILICNIAEGKKYEGAKNWGSTILRAEWLVECFKNKERVDETDFLIGNSKPSSKNVVKKKNSARDSIIPSSQEPITGLNENYDSPVAAHKRIESLRTRGNKTPKTPECNSDYEEMTFDDLCEDLNTPQRQCVKSVLLEQQSKHNLSPRAKRMKALLKTPGNAKVFEESSPAPPTPDCVKMPDRNYGFRPEASPASSMYYKMKVDAHDKAYESPKSSILSKKFKDPSPVTPSDALRKFLKTRNADDLDQLTMFNEADKFLNVESNVTNNPEDDIQVQTQDTEINELLQMMAEYHSPEKEKLKVDFFGESEDFPKSTSTSKKFLDIDPFDKGKSVEWSYTQAEKNKLERRRLSMKDSDDEDEDKDCAEDEKIFAVSGNEVRFC
jgi:twin BRCT domain/BRCA1 C Terminus (BRCT) domain